MGAIDKCFEHILADHRTKGHATLFGAVHKELEELLKELQEANDKMQILLSKNSKMTISLTLMCGTPQERLNFLVENNIPFNSKADSPDAHWIKTIAMWGLDILEER